MPPFIFWSPAHRSWWCRRINEMLWSVWWMLFDKPGGSTITWSWSRIWCNHDLVSSWATAERDILILNGSTNQSERSLWPGSDFKVFIVPFQIIFCWRHFHILRFRNYYFTINTGCCFSQSHWLKTAVTFFFLSLC